MTNGCWGKSAPNVACMASIMSAVSIAAGWAGIPHCCCRTLLPLQVSRLIELLVEQGMDEGSVQSVLQQVEEETGWGDEEGGEEGEGEDEEAEEGEDLT